MRCATILALVLPCVSFQDPADLIERLRSEDIAVREAAMKKLKELGKAAQSELEKAAKDADGEVAGRAKYLLKVLELKDTLTPNLLKAIPDAADRLAVGPGSPWTDVFKEATDYDEKRINRRFDYITRRDLETLAGPAILGARNSAEKRSVMSYVAGWRLRSGVPAAEQMLSDPDPMVRNQAFQILRMADKGKAPRVAELLKDAHVAVRASAISQLVAWKAREHLGEIRELLKGDKPFVVSAAMWGVAMLEGPGAASEVSPFLDDMNLKAEAAQVLGWLGAKQYSDRIATLLKDKEPRARSQAAVALGFLGDRRHLEAVARLLEDGDSQVRGSAALSVASLGDPEDGKRLLALLRDGKFTVPMYALMALGRLDSPEYVKEVVPFIKNANPNVQREAVEALRGLGAVMPREILPLVEKGADPMGAQLGLWSARAVGDMAMSLPKAEQDLIVDKLKSLESHPTETVRHAAAIALVRMGRKNREAQRELADRFHSTYFAEWSFHVYFLAESIALANEEKLRQSIEIKETIDSIDSLRRVVATVGLELDLGTLPRPVFAVNIRGGRRLACHRLLERAVSTYYPIIVDGEKVRFLEPEAALEFWLKRLTGPGK